MSHRIALVLGLAALLGTRLSASAQSLTTGSHPPRAGIRPTAVRPDTYGTQTDSALTIPPNVFTPFDTGTTYNDLGNGNFMLSRYPTAGNGYFYASVNAPGGALLTFLELDYCDSSTAGRHVHLAVYDCSFAGDSCVPVGPGATSVSNPASPCHGIPMDLTGITYQFDNFAHRLMLVVNADAFDGTNSISGAVAAYRLQVSPAPATASFVDVPTTSPIFRFVEALKASGITAGCDATHYCPNDPLTRGQMAVFLAAGLGLQFP